MSLLHHRSLIFASNLCFITLLYFFSDTIFTYNQVTVSQKIIQKNLINHNYLIIPRNIIQTGPHGPPNDYRCESFKKLNPNYLYLFYDNLQAEEFVRKHMSPEIIKTYEMLPRSILKADYFRYISIYILGGVYSDLDTECLRPIDTWTDNNLNVRFIVGVEAEGEPQKLNIARSLQLCQWTFAASPKHPILERMIDKITQQTKKLINRKLSISVIMDWTGPGLWTDTVFDYINETYHVEWPTLLKLKRGRLIGDIFIVPVAGFQPKAYYLGAKGRHDREARVWHYFYGTWKYGLRQS
jgi:mannosyltransferase OCH1-like enzyme